MTEVTSRPLYKTTATTDKNDARVVLVGRQHIQRRSSGALYFQPSRYRFILLDEQRHVCEQLAQELHLTAKQPGIELAISRSLIRRPTTTPPSHQVNSCLVFMLIQFLPRARLSGCHSTSEHTSIGLQQCKT